MFLSSEPRKILAYAEPVDLRKSIIGLVALVRSALCANVLETPTPIEFSVEGGEAEDHGVAEGVGLRG